MPSDGKRRVAAVRRFNRFYTRQIGVLRKTFLDSPYSLAEARVLYEIASSVAPTASAIGRTLDLLLRLERRLGPPLCVSQPLGGSGTVDELQRLSPTVPNARKRPEFFLDGDVGDAPAASS